MPIQYRFRACCFTLNNATEAEHGTIINFAETCKYFVMQKEAGESLTPHLQGYAVSAEPRSMKQWKAKLSTRCHIESAKGSALQNKIYCTKEPRIEGPWEFGTIPQQGKRNDLEASLKKLTDPSKPLHELMQEETVAFVKFHRGIERFRTASIQPRNHKTHIFWFYGPTGTGKSTEAHELTEGKAFWKQGGSHWWCGYDGHEDVIIDDYRRDLCTFSELLRIFDKFPYTAQTKGGNVQMVAKRIFVSTPKSPEETWEGRTEEDLQQLLRRIETIIHFKTQTEKITIKDI
jgi:hypothetical protein